MRRPPTQAPRRPRLAAFFASWAAPLRHLLAAACDDDAARAAAPGAPPLKPLYMLPVGLRWAARPGVADEGDAAHLMMPWAGEGVNLALRDALDLADAISRACDDFAAAPPSASFQDTLLPHVVEFDRAMFARAEAAAKETWANSKLLFSHDGARAMALLMASFRAAG